MLNAVIVGCGGREQIFAEYAKQHPDEMRVVAIADKKDFLREKMQKEYGLKDKAFRADIRYAQQTPKKPSDHKENCLF